jgi:polyisoprenoid-binding protein YceI
MMKSRVLAGVALAGVLALGCNNPGKDKPKAEVAEAVQAPAAAPNAEAAGSVTYKFGPPDSKLDYVGAKVTKKHDGSFGSFSGTIQVPEGNPEKGTVNAEIDVTTITSDDPKLTNHLKSPDFFDVQKFPKARFTSTSIKAGGADGRSHTVTGNLELKNVTKSITFPANIQISGDTVNVDGEFSINRKDWGIVYPGMPDDLIRDEVLIKLQIRAKKS